MKAFLIIVGAAIAIFLIAIYFLKKWTVKNNNPVTSIKFNGCMGFRLGDKKEYVFSRINHLKLMNEEEKENHQLMNGFGPTQRRASVSTSVGLFNNVERVSFHFDSDVLCSIMIHINPTQTDRMSISEILVSNLTSSLGSPAHTFNSATAWENGAYLVSITNDLNDENPYIYISDRRLNRI